MTEKQQLLDSLYSSSKTYLLNRRQAAKAINISTSTLDRLKKEGIGPKYQKDERTKNGRVQYTIYSIADYIVSNHITTR